MTDVNECRMFDVRMTSRDKVVTSLVACDGTHHFLVIESTLNPLNATLCDQVGCTSEGAVALDPNLLDSFAQARAGITWTVPDGHFLIVGEPNDRFPYDVYAAGDNCIPYEWDMGKLMHPTTIPVYLSHTNWSGFGSENHRNEYFGGECVTWAFWYEDETPHYQDLGFTCNEWLLDRRQRKLEHYLSGRS